MAKIRVKKADKSRILLTEVLPYEVPIPFTNLGLYRFSKRPKLERTPGLVNQILTNRDTNCLLPYDYQIIKNSDKIRTLSIMHPQVQLMYVDFYSNYDSLIINLCSKSLASIRYPSKVASHFYQKKTYIQKKKLKDSGVEVEKSPFETEIAFSSSYFTYKDYDFLYKFYDSYKFHRLEKKFKKLLRFDIANCFPNIYSHSIAWAVKGKEFAKQNTRTSSFENKFDKLMQWSNFNETNGIIIGPETSRIFAEIILQKIELNVISKIESSLGLKIKKDYAICRYVDDYFVFTNDFKNSEEIKKAFIEELKYYKLALNDSKTKKIEIPFITGITIARIELEQRLTKFWESCIQEIQLEKEGEKTTEIVVNSINRPFKLANKLIRDLKSIIKKNNVDYEDITGITVSLIRNKLVKILDNKFVNEQEEEFLNNLSNPILVILDILFFLVAMDSRSRATVLLTQVIVLITKFLKSSKIGLEQVRLISKKIFDGVRDNLDILNNDSKTHLESLNLLVALVNLNKQYPINKLKFIQEVFENEEMLSDLDYFQIIVILYFIEDSADCALEKEKLENSTIRKFTNDNDPMSKAEFVYLFFDFIACPHIKNDKKNTLIEVVYNSVYGSTPSISKRGQIRNYISKNYWFMDWRTDDVNIEYILAKKEYNPPYSG